MRYCGSKARHAKDIYSAIKTLLPDVESRVWVEPFVGGGNMLSSVPNQNKIGIDVNEYAVAVLTAVRDGWSPPSDITDETYNSIKSHHHLYPPHLVGFVGFGASYAGKWFAGKARGSGRNLVDEARRNCLAQREGLRGAELSSGFYWQVEIPPNSVVYCDPPYAGTQEYRNGGFDTPAFWRWADAVSESTPLFVSEYRAPSGWECIWSKSVNSSLDLNTGGKKNIEKLFTKWGTLRGLI